MYAFAGSSRKPLKRFAGFLLKATGASTPDWLMPECSAVHIVAGGLTTDPVGWRCRARLPGKEVSRRGDLMCRAESLAITLERGLCLRR